MGRHQVGVDETETDVAPLEVDVQVHAAQLRAQLGSGEGQVDDHQVQVAQSYMEDNVGFFKHGRKCAARMMALMGYKGEGGLGVRGQGDPARLQVVQRPKGRGLDYIPGAPLGDGIFRRSEIVVAVESLMKLGRRMTRGVWECKFGRTPYLLSRS